jgi:hypothetical protein
MEQGQDGQAGVEAISQIALKVLANTAVRKSFAADPIGTLRGAGIDPSSVPEQFLDVLADMSYEELTVVSRVSDSMIAADISITTGLDLLF